MRVKLEDVCERGSSNIKQSDIIKMSGNYPIYGASGLAGKVNFYHQEQPYVAVVKDGAGIGRTTLNPAKSSVIGTMQYLIPKKNVLPEYLFYVVSYMHLEKYYTGATIPHIYFKDYKNKEFNLDNIEKQLEIIDVLGRCKKVIEARKQELVELDSLTKARFVELFGDILCNNKLPLVKLSEFVNIGSSKRIYANEYVDKGVPFYRSKEIRELGTGMKPSVELYIKQERYDEIKEKYGVPKKGDILIAAIGATIGYSWIVDTDTPFYYKDGNLIILSIKNNVNPIFLNYTMRILIEDFKNKDVAGSAQLALTIEKLEKMMVVNPDIKLQNQFADFVHQVNKSKVAVQKALDETQILFDSLMQKYFG